MHSAHDLHVFGSCPSLPHDCRHITGHDHRQHQSDCTESHDDLLRIERDVFRLPFFNFHLHHPRVWRDLYGVLRSDVVLKYCVIEKVETDDGGVQRFVVVERCRYQLSARESHKLRGDNLAINGRESIAFRRCHQVVIYGRLVRRICRLSAYILQLVFRLQHMVVGIW